jgi:hypothetical protein
VRTLDVATRGYLCSTLSIATRGYLCKEQTIIDYLKEEIITGKKLESIVNHYRKDKINNEQLLHNKLLEEDKEIMLIIKLFLRCQ